MSRYTGLRMPFGSAVSYNAPDTTREGQEASKLQPRCHDGILLGYDLRYGGSFGGGYVVAPLDAFRRIPMIFEARSLGTAFNRVTRTRSVRPRDGEPTVVFPLAARSLAAQRDFESEARERLLQHDLDQNHLGGPSEPADPNVVDADDVDDPEGSLGGQALPPQDGARRSTA